MKSCLLKLQIGPVQEFIAQARSTRDLWSGSYLLSWLMAAGIAKLLERGGILIYPTEKDQPLIDYHLGKRQTKDSGNLLTPNIPNVFVAILSTDMPTAKKTAQNVDSAIQDEWKKITEAVLNIFGKLGITDETKIMRFRDQIDHFPSISWQVTPQEQGYAEAYKRNSWQLDAVRQTRIFAAWGNGQWDIGTPKDSLTGKEEALAGGNHFAENIDDEAYRHRFKHADYLGALTLVKRVWDLAYLSTDAVGLKKEVKNFRILSTPEIASNNSDNSGLSEGKKQEISEKYFAVLALDGDEIGKWISGELSDPTIEHHKGFSQALGMFALGGEAQRIVRDCNGQLIYAGGDDLVALVRADRALACAAKLREAFKKSTIKIKSRDGKQSPDCSVGICMAHFKSPLQDVIHKAQVAEKRAKLDQRGGGYGRSAVAVTIMKHSGETIHWGFQWDSSAMPLYGKICKLLEEGSLSSRFPHRVCALLRPYLNTGQESSNVDAPDGFDALEIIQIEFAHAASHQGSKGIAGQLNDPLRKYLSHISGAQNRLEAIIGLCSTIAFAHRNRSSQHKSQNEMEKSE